MNRKIKIMDRFGGILFVNWVYFFEKYRNKNRVMRFFLKVIFGKNRSYYQWFYNKQVTAIRNLFREYNEYKNDLYAKINHNEPVPLRRDIFEIPIEDDLNYKCRKFENKKRRK